MNERKEAIRFSPRVETRLTRADIGRLDEAAKAAGKSRSDFIRQGLLWYLDNLENLKDGEREGKTAEAIRYASDQIVKAILSATDRICGMLARQGAEIGTLYELMWRASATPEAKEQFTAAANTAKQRQRTRLDTDEKAIAERTKKVVTS